MYKTTFALNTASLTDQKRIQYVNDVASVIYGGKGQPSGFIRVMSDKFGVKESDGLRAIIGGANDEWLNGQRQRLLESVYAVTTNASVADLHRPSLWEEGGHWQLEKTVTTPFDPDRSIPDIEYIGAYGLRTKVWETEIFMTTVMSDKTPTRAEILRAYVALSAFGFAHPESFFKHRR